MQDPSATRRSGPTGLPPAPSGLAPRVIAALVLREMSTRYGRTPGGYIWAFLEPAGMIVILGLAWELLARAPSLGTSYFLFKATGLLILQMFTVLGNAVGHSMTFSKPLLFYPRVTWIDAVIARFILNSLVVLAVATVILTGVMVAEQIGAPLVWPKIVLACVLALGLGLGVGVLNCFLFVRFPVWQQIWAIATRPLFLVSGVVILFEEMPAFAQAVLWYNPLFHITGIMREGFYTLYRPDYVSVLYVSLWIMVPMLAGLLLLRQFNRDLLNR